MNIDFDEHYDKIYRYCYFKVKNQYVAEDITQETFLRFMESSHYEDVGRPLAYMYTIARNLCVNEFRKVPTEELKEDMKQGGFEDAVVEKENLKQAMKALTNEEQELLLLRYVNEISFSDLSKLYGKSRFALYRELSKIRKKLERRLSDGT
ncbi:MAG: sigma-70 family RNA polymerase sigma factor [Agathobacter sp.]|nr:sigma-70 family RNA polymerase sigma factor [Agathobacter sp.]